MRNEPAMVAAIFALVSLAGCFGSTGGGIDSAEFDCQTVEISLQITNTLGGTHPVYRLNQPDENGDPVMMEVVAMGFQAGSDNEDPDPGQGHPGLEVPNPEIRLKECDTLVLHVTNNNQLAHTFHLHGGLQDWTNDGVPYVSQMPIHVGETKTYVFEDLKAGTYWYHCHVDVAHHIDLGMYGAFIVEEREPEYPVDGEYVLMLDEWDNCHVHGGVDPTASANNREVGYYPTGDADCQNRQFQDYYAQDGLTGTATDPLCQQDLPPEIRDQLSCGHGDAPPGRDPRDWYYTDFPVYTPVYNTFTINGKAFPDTKPIYFEEGKTYRIRLINVGEQWHSMHLHGHNFLITHRDGYEDPAPQRADTIGIGPGERYDLIVEADNPGFWVYHDHVGLNVANDYQAPGGMLTMIAYTGAFADEVGFDPAEVEFAIDIMDFTKTYHEEHGDHQMVPRIDTKAKISRDATGQVVLSY